MSRYREAHERFALLVVAAVLRPRRSLDRLRRADRRPAVVGGAMVATDRRTSGAQVDDEVIELKAEAAASARRFRRRVARVNTTSYNRMVLLTGEVPTRGRQGDGRAGRRPHRQRRCRSSTS